MVGAQGDGWPLVGRSGELALLDEEVGGRAGCVVVSGSVGVGKSRLMASWSAALEAAGGTAVVVRATRSTSTIPFGAFAGWIPTELGGAGDRLAVLQATAGHLAASGEDRVVSVDDAHLLDEGSAALVLHLVLHTPVGVLLTVRHNEPCPDAVVAIWKEGLGQRVELQPLTESQASELLQQVLGGPVEPEAERRVWQLTEGNPMYMRETVAAACAQGVLAPTEAGWRWQGGPIGRSELVELVSDRLDVSDPAHRQLLETLALGEPLPIEVVARLASADLLAEVEEQGLVAVDQPSAGELAPAVRLAHPLYSEVLRSELPALRARALCAALAEAALDAGMHRNDPVRVATWLLDSGREPSHPELLLEAALQARFADEYTVSVRFSAAAERAGAGWRATLLRAIALGPLGRSDEAEALLASLSTVASDPAAHVAAARVRAEQSFWYRGEDLQVALAILEEAVGALPAPERSALLSYGAELALAGLELDEAIRLATRAYDDAGSLLDRLHAVVSAGLAAVAQGKTSAARAAVEMTAPGAVGALHEDPLPALYVALLLSMTSVLDGRIDQAATLFETGLRPDRGVSRALTMYWSGRAALEQGRVGTSARVCREVLGMLGSRNLYGRGSWIATTLALAAAQSGDADTAAKALAWMDATTRARVEADELFAALARAWLSAARGDLAAARHTTRAAARRAAEAGAWMIEMTALLHAARLGDAAAVAPRLDELSRIVEGPYAAAAAGFARAAAAHDGDGLDQAAERFAAMGARLHGAEAAAAAVEAHGTAGRRGRQMASWATAERLAAQCEGAVTPLLARLGHEPLVSVLTAREREVAELAARGRTSREIAEALGVSVRTVHSHLNHSFTKLGISHRGELAALLHVDPVDPVDHVDGEP